MKFRLLVCIVALFTLFAASCGSDAVDTESADTETAATAVVDVEEEAAAPVPVFEDPEDDLDDGLEPAPADDSADDAMADETVPQRIVSLNPTATEMLFAIGAGDQVVAVDEYSYFPAEAPVTDLSGYLPNIEAIAGYEPDLVVSDVPIEGLEALGIANHAVPAATNLDDIYAQIEQLGALTGHVGEAAELVLQMQTDIDAVLASVPDRDVALTFYHEVDTTLYSVTSSTFAGYVYSLFGLENIADPADADGSAYGYPQLSEEFIVDANPDIIFLADTLYSEQTAETVAARPSWDQIRAVADGHVVELNDDVVSRWGPRIVDFIEAVGAEVNQFQTATS